MYLIVRNEEDIVAVVSDVPDFVDGRELATTLVNEFTAAYRMKIPPASWDHIIRYDDVKNAKIKVSIEHNEIEGMLVSLTIDGRNRRFREKDFRTLVGALNDTVKKLDDLQQSNP